MTSGRKAAAASTAAAPSWAVRTSWPEHLQHHRQRVGRVRVVVYDEDAARARPRAAVAAGAGGDRDAAGSGRRQPDDELAPPAGAVAAGLDGAAVHLDQPLDQRQADAQPALRPLQRRRHLREHLEQLCGMCSAAMPMPVSRTDTHDARSPCPPARQPDAPPGSVYLAALFSRLTNTWASRVGSASSETGSGGS